MRLRNSRALLAVSAGVAIWIASTVGGGAQQAPAAAPSQPPAPTCGGRSSQPQSVCPEHVEAMMAALPDKPPAKPARPRKVLVLVRDVRVGARLHSDCREDDGGARQEDRRVDRDRLVRPLGDHGGKPEAVRRGVPQQHDRDVPRRAERRDGSGGQDRHRCAPQGADGLHPKRQRHRGHSRRQRLVPRQPGPARARRPRRRRRRCGRSTTR